MTYKNFIIFDAQNKDSQIIIKQGEIIETFTCAFEKWTTVFNKNIKKDRSINECVLKRQLNHIYDIDPEKFLEIFKNLIPEGESYPILKEILKVRAEKLKKELFTIEEALK